MTPGPAHDLEVYEAETAVLGLARTLPVETVPLEAAAGRVLREPVQADAPYPPFPRACMDGYALASRAWEKGIRRFPVRESVAAGGPLLVLDKEGICVEIATGAPCPEGCDAVVPVEEARLEQGVVVFEPSTRVFPGRNLQPAGSNYAAGSLLVAAGVRLKGPHLLTAAAVGCSSLRVSRKARIALVSTGSELVPVDAVPGPGQIRRSNAYGLAGMLDGRIVGFDHAADSTEELSRKLEEHLRSCDVLVITGGVALGRWDLVPDVLAELGVRCYFHKVRQKPGKPLWFGSGPAGNAVFGLPGNPVSALVCARRYVGPYLEAAEDVRPRSPVLYARLRKGVAGDARRTVFLPVRLSVRRNGYCEAEAAALGGSGDFAGLTQSQGFVELSPRQGAWRAGEAVPLYLWNRNPVIALEA